MSRRIKVGDKVQAFLMPSIIGEVISIGREKNSGMSIGGTLSSTYEVCGVKILNTEKVVRVKAADLFILEY